ncbi:MAG: HAMP domain-containing histidine kinase, partial [Bacteroidia bacterium]|nr:HAMP domain-containing histidine kinase [Bacteroidia bacterium]
RLQNSNLELKDAHNQSKQILNTSINVFGAVASGIQGYVNTAETFPTDRELQKFVNSQLNNVSYTAPIVVSFIDTTQTFIYSFTRDSINPDDLVGTTVASLRTKKEIENLNQLLKTKQMRMFPPINLKEGWVGFPINFRIHRDGETLGYIAAIVQFKSIINTLYSAEQSNKYVYKFETNGVPFDREQVYDGSTKYHSTVDNRSFSNYDLDSSQMRHSNLSLFGLDLKISTWRNTSLSNYSQSIYRTSDILLAWFFLSIALLSIIITRLYHRKEQYNKRTRKINKRLKVNRAHIQQQNVQLVKLNATKDRFFSIIAHDLRGPLGSLTGLIELIHEDKSLEPEVKGLMAKLKSATGSTSELLDSLLKWSMSQTGDIPFNPENLDIHETIDSTLNLVSDSASKKNISIENNVHQGSRVHADKNMLSTVVRNIITNAIKFTPKNGSIAIFSEDNVNETLITIEDSGIGMNESQIDSLFELKKHHSKGTEGESGTGLGLVVCKEFIAKHKGDINVRSEVGSGTTFIISLPNKGS